MAQALQSASWIWRQGDTGADEFCDLLTPVNVPALGKRYYRHRATDSNYTV